MERDEAKSRSCSTKRMEEKSVIQTISIYHKKRNGAIKEQELSQDNSEAMIVMTTSKSATVASKWACMWERVSTRITIVKTTTM